MDIWNSNGSFKLWSKDQNFLHDSRSKTIFQDIEHCIVLQRGLNVGVGGAEPSEQEVLGVMMRGHDSMMAVLTARERALQVKVP